MVDLAWWTLVDLAFTLCIAPSSFQLGVAERLLTKRVPKLRLISVISRACGGRGLTITSFQMILMKLLSRACLQLLVSKDADLPKATMCLGLRG